MFFGLPASAQDMDKVRQGCTDNGFMPGTTEHASCMSWLTKILREGPSARADLENQCWWAMNARGGSSDATRGNVCSSDPMAHLRATPKGMDCTAQRDIFGRLLGMTCR